VQGSSPQLLDAPPEQLHGGIVRVVHVSVGVERAQRLAHAVGHGAQVLTRVAQLLGRPHPLGRVDDDADEPAGLPALVAAHDAADVRLEQLPVVAQQLALDQARAMRQQVGDRRRPSSRSSAGSTRSALCRPRTSSALQPKHHLRTPAPDLRAPVDVAGDDGCAEMRSSAELDGDRPAGGVEHRDAGVERVEGRSVELGRMRGAVWHVVAASDRRRPASRCRARAVESDTARAAKVNPGRASVQLPRGQPMTTGVPTGTRL
jgi:hypothetical protein